MLNGSEPLPLRPTSCWKLYIYICVCVREREREREAGSNNTNISALLLHQLLLIDFILI